MRDQEIVGLYEAYQSIYSNVNEEVEQLDELSDRTVSNALNARIDATGAAADRAYKHRNPEAMRAAEKAADEEARMRSAVARRRKRKGLKEEVETWVNSLVEEGYDLSDYTWDDMYEMYMNLDEEAPQRIQLEPSPRLMPHAGPARVHNPKTTKPKKVKKVIKETNLFNYLLEYLVAEGYADTNKAAINIMSHMSEEWKQDIVEAMSSYDRNRKRAAQRAAERNAARDRGQTGNVPGVGYVSPRREKETYTDEGGQERHKSGARMPKKD